MQVHAFDGKEAISAADAQRGTDYICPECLSAVRLRGGRYRSLHFFHINKNRDCRQAQKGVIHLKLQQRLASFFEDAVLEVPFPSIGRIADVACKSSKIVYEIQYSPMSIQEAQSRISDYTAVGYTVIWILHDHTFNKRRLSPVEQFLRAHPCYYSNINELGDGVIYDQLHGSKTRSPVDLKKRFLLPDHKWPKELENRGRSWPFYHAGDLLNLARKGELYARNSPSLWKRLCEGYLFFLQRLLDKSSS